MSKTPSRRQLNFESLIIDNIYPIKCFGEVLVESKSDEVSAAGVAVMMMARAASEAFYGYMENMGEQDDD